MGCKDYVLAESYVFRFRVDISSTCTGNICCAELVKHPLYQKIDMQPASSDCAGSTLAAPGILDTALLFPCMQRASSDSAGSTLPVAAPGMLGTALLFPTEAHSNAVCWHDEELLTQHKMHHFPVQGVRAL